MNFGKIICGKVKNVMNENIYCFLSEVGCNNFYYPTRTKVILKREAQVEVLPWISTDKNLTAIKVKNKDLVLLTNVYKAVNINSESYSVVWISNELLPLSSVG